MVLSREPLLGTRASVHIAAASDVDSDRLERVVLDEVERLEQIFTVFDESSELCEFRRTGSTTSSEFAEVFGLAQRWRMATGRAFDPYCQPIFDAWDSGEVAGRVPEHNELEVIVSNLDEPELLTLNLNAIAKGWIGERALRVAFDEHSFTSGWVSLGGDLKHIGEGSMVVGIENPFRPYDNEPPLARIEVSNEALATSGGSRRWWTIGERQWSKVLDPRTGMPADRVASATVVSPGAGNADVLATVMLVLDEEDGVALLRDHDAIGFIVRHDGSVLSTSDRFELR